MKNPSFLDNCRSNGLSLIGAALIMATILGSAAWYDHTHPHYWTYETHSPVDVSRQAMKDYQVGRYQEAEMGFRAATVLEPTRMEHWYNLGNACFKQGKYQDAIVAYLKAYDLAPSDPDIRYNLNLAWRRMAGG